MDVQPHLRSWQHTQEDLWAAGEPNEMAWIWPGGGSRRHVGRGVGVSGGKLPVVVTVGWYREQGLRERRGCVSAVRAGNSGGGASMARECVQRTAIRFPNFLPFSHLRGVALRYRGLRLFPSGVLVMNILYSTLDLLNGSNADIVHVEVFDDHPGRALEIGSESLLFCPYTLNAFQVFCLQLWLQKPPALIQRLETSSA